MFESVRNRADKDIMMPLMCRQQARFIFDYSILVISTTTLYTIFFLKTTLTDTTYPLSNICV